RLDAEGAGEAVVPRPLQVRDVGVGAGGHDPLGQPDVAGLAGGRQQVHPLQRVGRGGRDGRLDLEPGAGERRHRGVGPRVPRPHAVHPTERAGRGRRQQPGQGRGGRDEDEAPVGHAQTGAEGGRTWPFWTSQLPNRSATFTSRPSKNAWAASGSSTRWIACWRAWVWTKSSSKSS